MTFSPPQTSFSTEAPTHFSYPSSGLEVFSTGVSLFRLRIWTFQCHAIHELHELHLYPRDRDDSMACINHEACYWWWYREWTRNRIRSVLDDPKYKYVSLVRLWYSVGFKFVYYSKLANEGLILSWGSSNRRNILASTELENSNISSIFSSTFTRAIRFAFPLVPGVFGG